MTLEEILSVEPGSENISFDYLSVRKNFSADITAAIGSKRGRIIVIEFLMEGSELKPVRNRSFSGFTDLNGLSLSPDASRLFYTGGTDDRSSGFFDLTKDSELSFFNLPVRSQMTGICSYNPVRNLVAESYWNDAGRMNIQFLSYDSNTRTYLNNPEVPEITGEYLISSLSWSSDGNLLMITTGEVDDGYAGTSGSVEIISLAGSGNNRGYLYTKDFSQIIESSGFNHEGSVAAFSFDDKIRFIDVKAGKVLSTRRNVNTKDIAFYNSGSGKLFYTLYSLLYCLELKTLKDCFRQEFEGGIIQLELLPSEISGFNSDLLFILFSSGKLSILTITDKG